MNRNTLVIGVFLIVLGVVGLVGSIGQFLGLGPGQPFWVDINSIWEAIYRTYWTNIPIALILIGVSLIQLSQTKKVEKKDRTEELKNRLSPLINKFLNSDEKEVGIKTKREASEVINPLKKVISEMGERKEVRAEVRENKIYLVKKSEENQPV